MEGEQDLAAPVTAIFNLSCLLLVAMHLAAAPVAAAEQTAAAAPAEQRFDVWEYRVLGNTVLPAEQIESQIYPLLGPGKVLADVEQARVALEQTYRKAGYGTVYVDIPEQDVDSGVVRLQVTEGKLRSVRVQGARYFSGRAIRTALPGARPDTVPQLPELQKQISAINTLTPDRTLVPVLAAGPIPGTVDLTLKVDDHLPLHGALELNDQYTAETSKLRALTSVSYDNLFNRLDSVALQYQTAPEATSEVGVFVASYTARLNDAGARLALYYVDSSSEVASVSSIGTASVLGAGNVYGTRLILPLSNTAAQSHSVSLGADYKDFLEDIRQDAADPFKTPIAYLNFSAGHSSAWRSERQQWTLSNTFNFGPRGFQNSEQEFADKRFRGRPNYFYLRSEAASRMRLFADFSVLLSVAGQFAVEPLISNEQFSIGGADGVRGFLEAEELGDMGAKATLQLTSPPWHPFRAARAEQLQLEAFGFYDAGEVALIDPLDGEPARSDLRSWGLGFNILAAGHYSGTLSWAYPLVDGSHTQAGDSRLLFSVRSSW